MYETTSLKVVRRNSIDLSNFGNEWSLYKGKVSCKKHYTIVDRVDKVVFHAGTSKNSRVLHMRTGIEQLCKSTADWGSRWLTVGVIGY